MATVEPIFAHNTLDHAVIHRVLWVWIWAAALTVDTREVLVVDILLVVLLHWEQLASLPKSGATIAAKVALGVKLNQCMALKALI